MLGLNSFLSGGNVQTTPSMPLPPNVHTSHPLIPNSQEYIYYKKYISIHSEDRDVLKYPQSSEFEIELPEDYCNVSALKLVQWTFPANYSTFSHLNSNVMLAFRLNDLYNPAEHGVANDTLFRTFEALFNSDKLYYFMIEEGFYNPLQMATELTNKFNHVVSIRVMDYFAQQHSLYPNDGWDQTSRDFVASGGYNRFVVVYNNVSLKLWFGNRADQFTLLSDLSEVANVLATDLCAKHGRQPLPDFSNYGLPSYLGLSRCNQTAVTSFDPVTSSSDMANGLTVPRFYYGDVTPGDNGFWLLPQEDASGSRVYWVEALWKLNIMGEAYLYMEIAGQNCIDETKPFNVSKFTTETNQTNGVVNSSFAKLAVPTTPLSQWFDRDSVPYKLYYPPAERMRRLKFRIRYHNGQLANFGAFNFSFMLELTMLVPQMLRTNHAVMPTPPFR